MLRRLLPWLMTLCLLANNIAGAMAAVSMHAAPPAQPHASVHHALAVNAPSVPGPHARRAAADHGSHTSKGDCDKDCCRDTGKCQCVCLHAAQAVAAPCPALAGTLQPARIQTRVLPAHPAPLPAERIRPPIA